MSKSDHNRVSLIGNLGGDPIFREFENGGKVASFSLAINKYWKNDDGEEQQKTTWVDCRINGAGAQIVHDHLSKGRRVFVDGSLVMDTWQDKNDSSKTIQKLRVLVDEVIFLDSRKKDDSASEEGPTAAVGASEESSLPF